MGNPCSRRAPVVTEGMGQSAGSANLRAADKAPATSGDGCTTVLGEAESPRVIAESCSRSHSADGARSGTLSGLMGCLDEEMSLEKRRRENVERASECCRRLLGLQFPEAKLAQLHSIDERFMFVVDGMIPPEIQDRLYQTLQTDAFRRTEFARPDTREFRHHLVEYNPDRFSRTPLFEIINMLVQAFFPPKRESEALKVYRIYTNSVMYGDVAFVHRDSSDTSHVTALVYPNPEWKSELGGETVFYYESGEIAASVEPKPGRMCIFQGNIQHKGSPPGRLFYGSRYTTAFKFSPPEPEDPPPPGPGPPQPPPPRRLDGDVSRPGPTVYGPLGDDDDPIDAGDNDVTD